MAENKDVKEIVKWTENLKGAQQYIKDFANPLNWGVYRNFYRGEFPLNASETTDLPLLPLAVLYTIPLQIFIACFKFLGVILPIAPLLL